MNFRLWVTRAAGAPYTLEIEAPSLRAAEDTARADGLRILAGSQRDASATGQALFRRQRFSVHLFTQEIVALLSAGLTLLEGLRALAGKAEATEKRVLDALLSSLSTGKRFSDALELHPEFPPIYVSLVRASERTSDLPTSLERYLVHSSQMEEAKQRIISAAIYPALLMIVGGGALIFLLTYVVPRFSGIYDGMRGDLPWSALVMMHWSHAIRDHGVEIFLLIAVALAAFGLLLASKETRALATSYLHRVPVLGEQIRLFHLARLYRTVGMLLEGGITLTNAFEMSMDILPTNLRRGATAALASLREGVRPSIALNNQGLSSSVADQMLLVGERSGGLGAMMSRIAAFYEVDTSRKLQRAMSVFEPVLMAFIGIGIGIIVVLMYLPIFELAGSIQ